ncbi:MAG: RtcB family protein [Holophagales bacterium]|nr:RtcB family protein [Holophagales bacterium]
MKKRELINLGFGRREWLDPAIEGVRNAAGAGLKKSAIRRRLKDLAQRPAAFLDDEHFGALARAMSAEGVDSGALMVPRADPVRFRQWGGADVDMATVRQMENACRLPIAVRGALMPDAHLGYGLPIGGVLATRDAVIPYAVGVDIACRMKMTVLDLPVAALDGQRDRLKKVLEAETRFGIGAEFRDRRDHAVLDEDWSVSPVTQRLRDKAWRQLGTSGSGNHFVEFGELEVFARSPEEGERSASTAPQLELGPGRYLALLSHSGSRGTGAQVCSHYSRLASQLSPSLPKELKHLAWLDLGSEPGQEYWQAMQLMGRYAAANHALIHRHMARALGAKVRLDVENHHNFAWREAHDGENVIVHRKGATPASLGEIGIIPGSMASPAYLVAGKGEASSLESAAHGAGRVMSRRKAKESFTWSQTKKLLRDRGVELLSAGLDEVPMAYRDIDRVMEAQGDLVVPLARFFPRVVKMAPPGERAED